MKMPTPLAYGFVSLDLSIMRVFEEVNGSSGLDILGHPLQRLRVRGELEIRMAGATAEALYWLKAIEEYTSKNSPSYWEERQQDSDGASLSGLMWIRNAAQHELDFITTIHRQRSKVHVRGEDTWHPVGEADVAVPKWRDVSGDIEPDKYGRDRLYREHVATEIPSWPLLRARRFLVRATQEASRADNPPRIPTQQGGRQLMEYSDRLRSYFPVDDPGPTSSALE